MSRTIEKAQDGLIKLKNIMLCTIYIIFDKNDKSTLRQCTWRNQLVIGSCGGTLNVGEGWREIGTPSRRIFLNDFRK